MNILGPFQIPGQVDDDILYQLNFLCEKSLEIVDAIAEWVIAYPTVGIVISSADDIRPMDRYV